MQRCCHTPHLSAARTPGPDRGRLLQLSAGSSKVAGKWVWSCRLRWAGLPLAVRILGEGSIMESSACRVAKKKLLLGPAAARDTAKLSVGPCSAKSSCGRSQAAAAPLEPGAFGGILS